jgi:hypothetical protein
MNKRTRCSQNNTSSTHIFSSRRISLHHRVGTVLDGKEAPVIIMSDQTKHYGKRYGKLTTMH